MDTYNAQAGSDETLSNEDTDCQSDCDEIRRSIRMENFKYLFEKAVE